MAREMQRLFVERMRAIGEQAHTAPVELKEINARIERLQTRRAAGDPDVTDDEWAAAIGRASATRRELIDARPTVANVQKGLAALPQAAELYRRQIDDGLDGHPQEAARARLILRDIFGGKVPLTRRGHELWAHIKLRPEALLLPADGTCGSGGSLWYFPTQRPDPLRQARSYAGV